jgi:4'-phosphopantetheinyl transferase
VAPSTVSFNVSHLHAVALYAVTRSERVGIDVERIRTDLDVISLASRFFSPQEYAVLRALPPQEQCQAFFNGWTRKEAYVKALGGGLAVPLDSFDVALAPGQPARLIDDRADRLASQRWRMRALPVGEGYAVAVVIEAQTVQWRLWEWRGADQ